MRHNPTTTPTTTSGIKTVTRSLAFVSLFALTLPSQSPIQAKNHEVKLYPTIKKIGDVEHTFEGITWRDRERLHLAFRDKLKKSLPEKYRARSAKISREILTLSQKYKINPLLVMAFIQTESSFKPEAIGPVGEIGLMQLRFSTAQYIAEKYELELKDISELKNPLINVRIGVAYLSYLKEMFEESPSYFVPAYNVGPTKMNKLVSQKEIPQEYASKIVKNYNLFAKYVSSGKPDKGLANEKKKILLAGTNSRKVTVMTPTVALLSATKEIQ